MLVRFSRLSSLRLYHLYTSSLSHSPSLPHRCFSLHSSIQPTIASHDENLLLSTNHRPDPASLLHLVQTLCSSGRAEEAHHRLLLLLLSSSPHYTNQTYNALVSVLLKSNSPVQTLCLLLRLSHVRPFSCISLSTFNKLIHLLADRFIGLAHRLMIRLHCTGPSPDTVTYTIVIGGYANRGDFGAARRLFDEMIERDLAPNSLTWSILIKAALRKRAHISEAKLLLEQLWLVMQKEKEGGLEVSVRNAAFANLLQCLCHEALFHEVFRIAEDMPQGDCISEEFAYSQIIDSLCRYGQYQSAVEINYIMKKRGLTPSSVSYNCIIHGLCLSGDCKEAYDLLKEGDHFGYALPEVTYKAIVESLCRENDIGKSKDVLEIMLKRDIGPVARTRLYNIFLSALHIVKNPSEQLDVLVRMLENQCQPDTITLNTIIHGFCKVGKVNEARKIMHDMIDGKFPSCRPDAVTFTTVIRGLLDTGQSDEALDMLRSMVPKYGCVPNTVTYNAIIKGLIDLKKVEIALKVFDEMLQKGVSCDGLTYTCIIKGLFEAGRVEEAMRFWDDVIWPSKKHDDFVYSAILRGFCLVEKFDQACDFLYKLANDGVKPGVVNYNILIDYSCRKGMKRKAYFILNQMRRNRLEPDPVTWRTLNQLHNGDKVEIMSSKSDDNQEVKDLSENLEVNSDNSFLHCNLDESLEGFMASSICAEQKIERTCDVTGDILIAKHSEQNTEEPLSKIARRVFGLL